MEVPRRIARALLAPGLAALGIALLQTASPGLGGLVFSLGLGLLFLGLVYSLLRMIFRRAERPARALRIGLWLVTVFIIAKALNAQDRAAREEIEAAIAAITEHQRRHGREPATLAEAGLDAQRLRDCCSTAYQPDTDPNPDPDSIRGAVIFYSQPSMPLVTHHFHFRTGRWERRD